MSRNPWLQGALIGLIMFPFIWFGVFTPNLDKLPTPWATGTEQYRR